MPKAIRYFLFFLLLLFLLRGPLFRLCVQYVCTEERAIPVATNANLRAEVLAAAQQLPADDGLAWAYYAQDFTAKQLKFRPSANQAHPDEAYESGQAHCVGYAALMAAVLRTIQQEKHKTGHEPSVRVTQCRGDLYLFGCLRLTGPQRPPFFRDHDYVKVELLAAQTSFIFDPSVYDYLWIKRVAD